MNNLIDSFLSAFNKHPVFNILLIDPENQSTQSVDIAGVKDLSNKFCELLECQTLGRLNLDQDNFLFFNADDDAQDKRFGYYMEGSFGVFRDVHYGKAAVVHVASPHASTTWDDAVFRGWFQWVDKESVDN